MSPLPDRKTTALIAIDLQRGIVSQKLAPHAASDVLRNSASLAGALRTAGGMVVFTRVLLAETLRLPADSPLPSGDGPPPETASELAPDCGAQPGDHVVTKRQWGAFYGTDLDQLLRRKGVRALVLTGIATNFGVESTAREALDRGYEVIFAEDALSSMSAEAHGFVVKTMFPIIGRVRSTQEILAQWT